MGVSVAQVILATLLTVLFTSPVSPSAQDGNTDHDAASVNTARDPKFFNLQFLPFVTVKVKPTRCTTTDMLEGTCASGGDCSRQGGTGKGSCASGYGVCCVYRAKCGRTVTRNNTYLVNNNYPNDFTNIDNCQYTIQKLNNNICQLRLDFENLTLTGPDNNTDCTQDTFTFTGSAGSNPTIICGENSGQHMYLDLDSGTGAARVNIATTLTGFARRWNIKVAQIPCNSPSRAPKNCLQYYTDLTGTINSFNYEGGAIGVQQLADQQYTACIRTREGFCGIRYSSNDFSMSGNATNPVALQGDADCNRDYIVIPYVSKNPTANTTDRFCGSSFDGLTTYSKPFEIRVVTDGEEDANTEEDNRGFSISYTQIPC